MQQLSGMDSMFLYADTHRAPLEVGSLQIYDPSTAPNGKVRFKEVLATFQSRMGRFPMFRQKLVEVPLSLDHPYWTEDEDFDLEYHVRHISLPKPGDWSQLMAQVARLQARSLDRSRPMWIAHVIEGLGDIPGLKRGAFALYMKMHHSMIDGVTGRDVQAALHDLEPIQADVRSYQPSAGPGTGTEPNRWNLVAKAPLSALAKSTRLTLGLLRATPGLVRAGIRMRSKPGDPVPRTPFNEGRVSPNRVVDGRIFDLATMKQISAAVPEMTVNDVALCVVAGAMRGYLKANKALPEESLVVGCPINVGTDEDARSGRGNLLTIMTVPVHTEVADPVQRLKAIHRETLGAKAATEDMGARTLTEIPLNLPAPIARNLFPLLAEIAVRTQSLTFNTMVTNVAGIQKPVYLSGARMIRMMGLGPVIDQAGIFHTVFSYDGMVAITVTACRKMLPDAAAYADQLEASFRELEAAALGASRPPRKVTRKKRRKVTKKAAKKTAARRASSTRKTTARKARSKAGNGTAAAAR
ncbi:MAG: wax ester/triacylglycerol synthase family O-acyltransferase [Xanthomonadales bacterium]|nr:wax ester/triacylglycerol synthase family O-acyltransferase [Xanthomonadales bacterium]